jgi:hypothetical protein
MYEVRITPEMKEQALNFAKEKVESGTAYARTEEIYMPVGDAEIPYLGLDDKTAEWLKKMASKKRNQIAHWFVGKVGEHAGQEAFKILDIEHECIDKWKVVVDPHFGDKCDTQIYPRTPEAATVNFRTGWLPKHRLILVPPDMKPSDYYVGIKLDLKRNKAYVYGYAVRSEMEWNEHIPRPAYTIPYDSLHDLSGLKD